MRVRFEFDAEKCTACGACAVACMDQNDVDITAGQQPYRKVCVVEREGRRIYRSIACRHCANAPCVSACPVGCITKDEETELTRVDTASCIGCRACAAVCPSEAPTVRPVKGAPGRVRMEKCHGCFSRIEAGLTPACVHACPTGALTVSREEK